MQPKLNRRERIWYYFRIGYSTYITMFISFFGSTSALYYLAIKSTKLTSIFPDYNLFLIISVVVGVPLAILVGRYHFKSNIYKAEQEVAAESTPFKDKLPEGYLKETVVPAIYEILNLCSNIADGKMAEQDKERIRRLQLKIEELLKR